MFFTLINTTSKSKLKFKHIIIKNAKIGVILYKPHGTELRLDTFLKEKYKMSLKTACIKLINNATIATNSKNEFIVTFPSKKLDDLASLITYGNGLIQGSFILQQAFKRYYKQ